MQMKLWHLYTCIDVINVCGILSVFFLLCLYCKIQLVYSLHYKLYVCQPTILHNPPLPLWSGEVLIDQSAEAKTDEKRWSWPNDNIAGMGERREGAVNEPDKAVPKTRMYPMFVVLCEHSPKTHPAIESSCYLCSHITIQCYTPAVCE